MAHPLFKEINMLTLHVNNFPEAVAFYRDTLGLTPLSEDDFATVFDLGGLKLRLTTSADHRSYLSLCRRLRLGVQRTRCASCCER